MILNEDLFEDGIDMTSLEDKFRYIKDHATYQMGSNEYFSRDCRVWDLNLTDEQEVKFDDFLTHGGLDSFWDANAEFTKNIEQVGRMGGHLILSNKVADPRDFKYDDSYEDYEQNHLAQYYDIEYDESGDIDPEVIEENHEECVKIVNEVYDKVVDFNNRVDALIDLLKQTLDEESLDDLNDDSNFTESVNDKEKSCTHGSVLGKYGNIDKYYNDPDYNIYYKDVDMDKFELVDGFSIEDIIAAMGNGVQFVFKKGPASEPFNENLNEGQTRFSEIDTDLSQEIFNVVLPKKVIADDLVSFMYQFNDGLKAGMNKMELLVALKDARTPDEFGKYVYNNCDREKYNKIYNESKKVKNEAFNGGQTPGEFVWKMAQGFARENPETIKKLENKEKTIEQTAEELSNQFQLITKEMWEEVLKAACLCDTTPIEESFEDEHGVENITEEQPQVEIPAQNPQNEDNGLVAIINNLIKDEWDTIQAYKDAIVNFASQNKNDLTAALEDILNEENIHVGQLETLLKSLDASAENIEQGKQEAEEQINEDFNVETVKKRIARINEFDNGHVLFNYKNMTSDEAEEKAKQLSLKYPEDTFYVAYDDVMNPGSDIKWKNGQQVK